MCLFGVARVIVNVARVISVVSAISGVGGGVHAHPQQF